MNQEKINTKVLELLDRKIHNFSSEELELLSQFEPTEDRDALYAFFTPRWLCEQVWKLVDFYSDGKIKNVLEPACGTGNFIYTAPKNADITAYETNTTTASIASIINPEAKIYDNYFETAFMQPPMMRSVMKKPITHLEGYPFDVVIGNPPYGKFSGKYASYFKKHNQLETFFMLKGAELLRPGGLLAYVTASSFMNNMVKYNEEKKLLGEIVDLVDAVRLPKVFKNTQVPTDILIYRRK